MSIQIWNQVMNLTGDNISPPERFVLVILADHSDNEGYSWPSLQRIAQRTGFHERTIQRCLSALEQKGYLRITKRMIGDRQTSNGYYLDLQYIGQAATPHRTEGHPYTTQGHPNHQLNHQKESPSKQQAAKVDTEDDMKGGDKKPVKGSVPKSAVQLAMELDTEPISHEKVLAHYLGKPLRAGVVAGFWKHMMKTFHPEHGPVAEFKMKQLGMLKHWIGQFQANSIPVLEVVMKDWISFIKHAETHHAAYNSPLYPTVGWLLMNNQAALSFWHEKNEAALIVKTLEPKCVKIVKSNEKGKEEKPITLAEFLEDGDP